MKTIRLDSDGDMALMADSACRPDRRLPLFIPAGTWTVEVRTAVRVGRLGKAMTEVFASRHLDAWTLTAYLRPEMPSPLADMTDDALCTGLWQPLADPPDAPVAVRINGAGVAVNLRTLAAEGARALSRLSQTATFKTGDIIVLPRVLASFEARPGEEIQAVKGSETILDLSIK